jgi:hypothetical protein
MKKFIIIISFMLSSLFTYSKQFVDSVDIIEIPIELLNFTTTFSDSGIVLKLNTQMSLNNKEFIIEHSLDGIDYEIIKNIKETDTLKEFVFIDTLYSKGLNYYRLSQIHNDETLKILKVNTYNHIDDIVIYDVPFNNRIVIKNVEKNSTIDMFDIDGVHIKHIEYTHTILVNGISSGEYLLKITTNGKTITKNIIKL